MRRLAYGKRVSAIKRLAGVRCWAGRGYILPRVALSVSAHLGTLSEMLGSTLCHSSGWHWRSVQALGAGSFLLARRYMTDRGVSSFGFASFVHYGTCVSARNVCCPHLKATTQGCAEKVGDFFVMVGRYNPLTSSSNAARIGDPRNKFMNKFCSFLKATTLVHVQLMLCVSGIGLP
jgi:hypothetical protein